jgi:hypothetical protein
MLAGLLIFALVGCMGLFAALRPETYARYFFGGISAQGALRRLQGPFIDRLDNLFCLHDCHHSSTFREQAQFLGPGL